MGLFDKIKSAFNGSSQETELPEDKGQFIKTYNNKGELYQIPRAQWRNRILPEQFKKVWNDPDGLYAVIVSALQDNFFPEAIEPGKRLIEIDADISRSYNVLGITYLKNNLLNEAKEILETGISKAEYKAVMTTNLAKVYSAQGQDEIAMSSLWQALVLDPNQGNALDWFTAVAFENGGENNRCEAYMRVASLTNSWRAKLYVARQHLKSKEFEQAKIVYKEVIKMAPKEPDVAWIISGDLGGANQVEDIFELVYPIFIMSKDSINASLNLIQACIETRRKKEGLKLVNDFKKLERYDYTDIMNQLEKRLQALQ
jgi:tetratricopeptide (TPR) repeat protein